MKQLEGKPSDSLTISEIDPEIPTLRHMHTVGETKQWLGPYLGRSRLHLLIICSGNLETYLQEITFWYLYDNGFDDKPAFRLNPVGKAIGAPILNRASLPEPLKYAEKLFEVNFGINRTTWNKAYKLRCAAAHNGGVVTGRTLKDIPSLQQDLHEVLELDWNQLKASLASADRIAKQIDQKVSKLSLRTAEVEKELSELSALDKMPERANLWSFVFDRFQLKGLPSKTKRKIEERFYS